MSRRRQWQGCRAVTGNANTHTRLRAITSTANLRRETEERIDGLLLEGLDSGEPITVTPDYFEQKNQRLTKRLGKDSRKH